MIKLNAHMHGQYASLNSVKDEAFSSGMLGKGMAIIPEYGVVFAPANATIIKVFDTLHAVAMLTEDGVEILIHVGLDTVKLKGEHFESLVKEGDKVTTSQPILRFDLEKIKSLGYDLITPMVITNSDDLEEIKIINSLDKVSKSDSVIEVGQNKDISLNQKKSKPSNDSKILKWFQSFGRSLMIPIATIAAVGILYGFTAALSRPQVQELLPFLENKYAYHGLFLIREISGQVFGLIPVLFAISIAFGLAKKEKEIAAMAGFITYYVMLFSSSYMLKSGLFDFGDVGLGNMLGINGTIEMGAVGGMIAGILAAKLHNKYYNISLPVAIAFFGGKRFVSIAVIVCGTLLGQILPFIWMPISAVINAIGMGISAIGSFGIFIYGMLERLLIPTGLHHILNGIFRTTAAGGVYEGVEGVWNIFFQFFGTVDIEVLKPFTAFMAQGKIPYMVFGLPAAALGIYHATPKAKRKAVGPLLIAGALASITTGITEPIEFAFLFIAPMLFLAHSVMAGLSFFLMAVLGVGIGNTQGGLIDLFVYGFLVPNSNWIYTVYLGVAYAIIYYTMFKWYFRKHDLVVEASEEDEITEKGVGSTKSQTIIQGLGGIDNIVEINNCFTRLRVDVKDVEKIDETVLKTTGCVGIKKTSQTHVQIVYGPKVDIIASELKTVV